MPLDAKGSNLLTPAHLSHTFTNTTGRQCPWTVVGCCQRLLCNDQNDFIFTISTKLWLQHYGGKMLLVKQKVNTFLYNLFVTFMFTVYIESIFMCNICTFFSEYIGKRERLPKHGRPVKQIF